MSGKRPFELYTKYRTVLADRPVFVRLLQEIYEDLELFVTEVDEANLFGKIDDIWRKLG